MCDLIGQPLIDGTLQYCDTDNDERRNYKSPRMSSHYHARAAAGIDFAQLQHYTKVGELCNNKGKAFQQYCYVCQTHGINVNAQ